MFFSYSTCIPCAIGWKHWDSNRYLPLVLKRVEKAKIRNEHSLCLVTCIQMYSDDIALLRVNPEQK